jgi:hypothetical protein
MATKPSKPSGDFELRDINYSEDGIYEKMTDNEFRQGRNNTGEVETPLGSVPNSHKDNYLFQYFSAHISYLEQMVDYLSEKVEELSQ